MKAMERLGVPEPHWILDRTDSGPLVWRRDQTGYKSRVKFRFDVEIKEFCRGEHELQDAEWTQDLSESNHLTMGMTCLFCLAITVMLPWYIIGIS